MKLFLSICFLLFGMDCMHAFHINRIASLKSSTLRATTQHAKEVYDQIKSQMLSSFQSKAASSGVNNNVASMLASFLNEYGQSCYEANLPPEKFQQNIVTFFRSVGEAAVNPYKFPPYHQAVRQPVDYYQWGNDFLRPLVIASQSRLVGLDNAKKIEKLVEEGENIVILSNHQTEADPQVISILLQDNGMDSLAQRIIFLAGHKVTNDPVAIPFSMGRNLICIHSKKHIKNPPEEFQMKQAQNLETMNALGNLFNKGGNIFWVAPSGGRDRPNDQDKFVVANYDGKVLDMFRLLSSKSTKGTHFFPMAMYTHQLVPPPKSVSSDLGETRSANRGAVSIQFLDETNGLGNLGDKAFTAAVQKSVMDAYESLYQWHLTK